MKKISEKEKEKMKREFLREWGHSPAVLQCELGIACHACV